jgi:UDP-N-acetylglucosamine:LPS N-acetylglucosamine transferase
MNIFNRISGVVGKRGLKRKARELKICIACSPGGHMIQAKALASVYEKYNHFYFTFSCPVAKKLSKTSRIHTIPNIYKTNPISWITGAAASFYVVILERPDVIISTGASVVLFFCIFAKMLGAKLIFLESMAKVERPTLTARFLYPFTDLFIVQWPGLLRYFPKAKFLGRLF